MSDPLAPIPIDGMEHSASAAASESPNMLDFFAAAVLTGMTSACNAEGTWQFPEPEVLAGYAYDYAEAMVAEREKRK